MKRNILYVVYTLSILVLASCANPRKALESGNYDQAIEMASRRIAGKKKYKLKHVQVLEKAFRKAQERDMRKIDMLKKENRLENWTTIHSIHERIAKRQRALEPFIPVYAENGYLAEFKFIRIEGLVIESKAKAAKFHYLRAQDLISQGEQGDHIAARDALGELRKIRKLYRQYKDIDELENQANFLGTEQWLIQFANRSNVILPQRFENQLLGIGAREFDQRWRKFSTRKSDGLKYDYEVAMVIDDIRVSPEIEKERQFDESREVEDGFEYVLDENGNVLKDTAGNDVKIPRKVWISATVVEVLQQKTAQIEGRLIIRDGRTKDVLHSENVFVENDFENYASKLIRGDRKALTKDTKRRLGNSPVPFPSDERMLLDAVDALKDKLSHFLRGPHV